MVKWTIALRDWSGDGVVVGVRLDALRCEVLITSSIGGAGRAGGHVDIGSSFTGQLLQEQLGRRPCALQSSQSKSCLARQTRKKNGRWPETKTKYPKFQRARPWSPKEKLTVAEDTPGRVLALRKSCVKAECTALSSPVLLGIEMKFYRKLS